LASVKRNPELYMMIPSVTDTELFCPGKKAGTRYDGNIKYVCMSSDDLYALMSSKMCKVWECDENESQKIKEEVKKWVITHVTFFIIDSCSFYQMDQW